MTIFTAGLRIENCLTCDVNSNINKCFAFPFNHRALCSGRHIPANIEMCGKWMRKLQMVRMYRIEWVLCLYLAIEIHANKFTVKQRNHFKSIDFNSCFVWKTARKHTRTCFSCFESHSRIFVKRMKFFFVYKTKWKWSSL